MSSITVIIPIYKGTKAKSFISAVDSILNQTLKPEQLIIAVDGPIDSELQNEVNRYSTNPIIRLVLSKDNIGLGRILKYAHSFVETELIARMDSDDVSALNRLEIQFKYFIENDLDILGSYISEGDLQNNKVIRKVPLDKKGILKRLQFRSPFNHVTILMKKSILLEKQNYEDCLYAEDWYLWLRLLKYHPELKVANLPNVLVTVNTNDYKRLSGVSRFRFDLKYLNKFYRENLIGLNAYVIYLTTSFLVRILLGKRAKWFYINVLRSKSR